MTLEPQEQELRAAVRAVWPAADAALVAVGAGDYARAYRSGGWLVLHARHAFADACLARVARVTPHLAPGSPVPMPHVEAQGESGGRRFVVYRALPGEPMSRAAFEALGPADREALAASLAALLRHLQGFPAAEARAIGVPDCPFPLAFEDDRLREGDEAALYAEDLARLDAHAGRGLAPSRFAPALRTRLERHLASRPEAPLVLLHGELSADHLLVLPGPTRWSGVIDLNGLHLGRPARELMYPYDSHGEPFVRRVLAHLPGWDVEATLAEVRFLHGWHLLGRLLWSLDHGYAPGRERWSAALLDWLA